MWGNLLLDTLVTGRHSLESTDPLQGATTPPGLVGQHASDAALEDLGGSAVMEGTTGRVDITPLPQESQELQLVPAQT